MSKSRLWGSREWDKVMMLSKLLLLLRLLFHIWKATWCCGERWFQRFIHSFMFLTPLNCCHDYHYQSCNQLIRCFKTMWFFKQKCTHDGSAAVWTCSFATINGLRIHFELWSFNFWLNENVWWCHLGHQIIVLSLFSNIIKHTILTIISICAIITSCFIWVGKNRHFKIHLCWFPCRTENVLCVRARVRACMRLSRAWSCWLQVNLFPSWRSWWHHLLSCQTAPCLEDGDSRSCRVCMSVGGLGVCL